MLRYSGVDRNNAAAVPRQRQPANEPAARSWLRASGPGHPARCAKRRIEGGQYAAILIDEGHDFAPDWFRLLVPLVDPQTNSLLVLYDDAQAIYADAAEGQGQEGALPRRRFSFKSVGVQAQGRTTVLRINYRNPEAILRFARATAWPALAARDAAAEALDGEDGAPLLEPLSAGGAGEAPQVVRLPSAQAEAEFVVRHLQAAHRAGDRKSTRLNSSHT